MTPDERSLLTRFLSDLNQVRGVQKDPDAAALISQSMNAGPDGPYLLVQHAILADQALATAQARISELETHIRSLPQPQSQPQQGGGGLLGGLFGGGRQQQQQAQPAYQPQPGPWGGPQPQSVTPQAQPQQAGFFGGGAPAQPGGMGSFLRNAGTTAAGVAGGAFLFEGISNLFGGGHGGGGFLGGGMGGMGGGENVTINEYGDQGGGGYDQGGGFDQGGGGDGGGYQDDPGGDYS